MTGRVDALRCQCRVDGLDACVGVGEAGQLLGVALGAAEGGAGRGLQVCSLADVQQLLQVGCPQRQRAQHAPDVEWNADHLHNSGGVHATEALAVPEHSTACRLHYHNSRTVLETLTEHELHM